MVKAILLDIVRRAAGPKGATGATGMVKAILLYIVRRLRFFSPSLATAFSKP